MLCASIRESPPDLPEDFAPPLADPNPEGRAAVFRGLIWAGGASIILWVGMFFSWRLWGWWGPPGVLVGGGIALAVIGLATRRASR